MEDGLYVEVVAVKDGKVIPVKIMPMAELSKIFVDGVLNSVEKLALDNESDEKGS